MLHKPDVLIVIPDKSRLKERDMTQIHISGLDAHTDTGGQQL